MYNTVHKNNLFNYTQKNTEHFVIMNCGDMDPAGFVNQ